jgi:hypothetical protein
MNAILFLLLVIVLGAALGLKGTYRRSQHHRPADQQPPAHEIKIFDHEALQKVAAKLEALDLLPAASASQNSAVKLCDGDSETYPKHGEALIREFGERWSARAA